jgi:hypothetical protein
LLRRVAPRNDVKTHHRRKDTPSRSRRAFSREFYRKRPALITEGAGNAGRSMRPQPRREIENTTS